MNLLFIQKQHMKKTSKNITIKYWNALDITSIEVLSEKLYLLLDKYIIQNNDICVYAMIHKNISKLQKFSLKDLEGFIAENYPQIFVMNEGIEEGLWCSYNFKNITDDMIVLGDKSYSRKELSNLILDHNKNLVMAGPNQYLLEKEKIIAWFAYNTPIMTNPTITPMTGTAVGQDLSNAKVKYIEWIMASSYLLKEFNIWNKAKYYLENKNSEFSSVEFKQAYYYYILRQFEINTPSRGLFYQKCAYIRDYNVNDIIYRELCEDILFILLNLLLADKIIGSEALENSLDNNDKFFDNLKGIIEDHYCQNRYGYECLKNLRWYTCNNHLSTYQIENLLKKKIFREL